MTVTQMWNMAFLECCVECRLYSILTEIACLNCKKICSKENCNR